MPQYTPGNDYEQYHKGDAPFQFPIWAIIAGFVTWWPLGFFFIIANSVLRSSANTGPLPNSTAAAGTPLYAQNRTVRARADQKLKAATAKVDSKADTSNRLSTVLTVVGVVLLLVGIAAVGEPVSYIAGDLLAGNSWWTMWIEDLFGGLAILGGGIASLCAGITTRTGARMRKKIENIVGSADHMYIQDIADAIPCRFEKCCKHLEKCIDKGMFGDDAYLDMRTKCLVVRGPAPQPQTRPKAKPAPAPKPEKTDRYQQILNELRSVNDAIPDDEMSEKIGRLETVSARIFRQAQANPDKLPQMRKFMDYYLPTALKLLKTYAELDAQGIEGDNIRLSKQRIEQAMDTLVVAFENQLDQLFQSDAMDVSADIEVMENMLRADGLAGSGPLDTPAPPAAPPAPRLEL